MALPARQGELGDVGEPEPVRGVGVEVAFDQVLGIIRYLAGVGAVAPGLLDVDDPAALLGHYPADDLLGDPGALGGEPVADVAIAPPAVGGVEYADDFRPYARVLVPCRHRPAAVLIGALRDPQETDELFQGAACPLPQPVDQHGLLHVGHRVEALCF